MWIFTQFVSEVCLYVYLYKVT